jgi:GDPmannose 4,6-dehydratase
LNYQDYVVQDHENFRLPETALLVGNPAKAKRVLGWQPNVTFQELVCMMVDADLRSLEDAPQKVVSSDEAGPVNHTQEALRTQRDI